MWRWCGPSSMATTSDSVRGFLVETDRPGFSASDIHGKWSLRASVTSGLSLQDVRVPETNLLPGAKGLKSALMCLNQARYGISWGAIGAAMDCYSTALNYAKARKQFHNQPIASHQLVQEKLVWMAREISKAQLLSLHVGRLKDAGRPGTSTSRWRSETTCGWRLSARGWRATFWARTA